MKKDFFYLILHRLKILAEWIIGSRNNDNDHFDNPYMIF
jgi:hypothetical protein